ncbi:MAG: nucleotidyltransferase family protein [Longimicrobiales bacterium]
MTDPIATGTGPPTDATHRHVAGIVLAAGRSSRMGEPKALVEIEGRSFLERAIDSLRRGGCRGVICVVGAQPAELEDAARVAGARVVVNPDADSEQLDSLRLGLAALARTTEAAIVLPVDHPLVRPETVDALIHGFRARGRPIVRVVHDGRPGHPTLFGRAVFDALTGDLPDGAESLIERRPDDVEDVAVDDPGVVADLDTPDAVRRAREARK